MKAVFLMMVFLYVDKPVASLQFDLDTTKETGLADHLGGFAVTSGIGLRELCEKHKSDLDDYSAIMAEALADRLAEAFAECLHKKVRAEWGYGKSEDLTSEDLIHEKYRGIRPAAGYPACPDHTEKGPLWKLLDVEKNTGMLITESFAMWPGSSVSGLYFAHPESKYFIVGMRYESHVRPWIERIVYAPAIGLTARIGAAARALQAGSVHLYLAYVCAALLALLLAARWLP